MRGKQAFAAAMMVVGHTRFQCDRSREHRQGVRMFATAYQAVGEKVQRLGMRRCTAKDLVSQRTDFAILALRAQCAHQLQCFSL